MSAAEAQESHEAIPAFELYGETERFPDVVHCERIADRAPTHGWRISAHRHHRMVQLFRIESGRSAARFDQRDDVLGADDFLYLPARVVHAFEFEPGTEGIVSSFPLDVVDSLGPVSRTARQRLAAPVRGKVTPRLADTLALLVECQAAPSVFRAQVTAGLAHALLSMVAELAVAADPTEGGLDRRRLRRLDTLIARHLSDGWGPGDYAAALSISTGHLTRLCRATRGVSASTYLETSVMTEACRLLAFTRLSVADVGYRLGYRDPSYFSRRFRRVQGTTPSAYRRRLRGVED